MIVKSKDVGLLLPTAKPLRARGHKLRRILVKILWQSSIIGNRDLFVVFYTYVCRRRSIVPMPSYNWIKTVDLLCTIYSPQYLLSSSLQLGEVRLPPEVLLDVPGVQFNAE